MSWLGLYSVAESMLSTHKAGFNPQHNKHENKKKHKYYSLNETFDQKLVSFKLGPRELRLFLVL